MAEDPRLPCDVDDVVCKMEVPVDLKGLPKGLGNAQFLDKFPELTRLEETISPFVKRCKIRCFVTSHL
jgi:hypothetical protein